jgi:choline-sulfatase
MTSVLPHNHGVLHVEHCVDNDQSVLRTDRPQWAQHLRQAGYHTGYFGKWHIERTNSLEDFGWEVNGCDATAAFRGLGKGESSTNDSNAMSLARYETGPEGYNPVLHYGVTDKAPGERRLAAVTGLACEFIASQTDKPWACVVSYPEPNTPLIAGREAFSRYDVERMELPANLHDSMEGKPAFYRRQQLIHRHTTEQNWRELRTCYAALVTELDVQLGRLIEALMASGQYENTIIFILSDHGRYLGAHGFDAHNFGAFEEAYRIPLIVAGPGIAENQVSSGLVNLADVGPTILELAGVKKIAVSDSRSFASLLTRPHKISAFGQTYAESHGGRFLLTQRILWQHEWKMVFNGFDFDELYNLAEDPLELHNLAAEPRHQERLKSMMREIWRIMRVTNDRTLLETNYSPMRIGIVGPNETMGKH